jgi:hypothetical protein
VERPIKIELGDKGSGVEFLERLGDVLGLRAGKAYRFELLDDAVRVNHERLPR